METESASDRHKFDAVCMFLINVPRISGGVSMEDIGVCALATITAVVHLF